MWVVLKTWSLEEINILNIDNEKIKSIISIKNNFCFLNKKQISLVFFIAKYFFTPIHNALNLFFPRDLKTKIKKDKIVLQIEKEKDKNFSYNFYFDKQLSDKQEKIFQEINNSKENKFLLHWVTGSWKTEIYIKLIKKQLELWKQSLLLIPEIILTNQLETRLKKVFWENVLVINSSITESSKTKAWLSINSWESKIILWTRSSLFYPYPNLWLIIIDEEHDNSYQSDQAPRYNSIEIANKITDLNWNKLLLASWTPSIQTMYDAVKGKYKLLKLLEKFNN
jgi:primosomal protein N' (replication factor Y)